MAAKNGKELHGKFSGLGVPRSFEKLIFDHHDAKAEQVELIEEVFRSLCRGIKLKTTDSKKIQTCYHSSGQSFRNILSPFKVEKLSDDPRMKIYYDVISDEEIKILQEIAFPRLETARVKPYTNAEIMKSIARIGKSAWLKRGVHPLIENLFRRIERMTGLKTKYAEKLHVLNYGVGGQYELHLDFFDFANLNDVDAGGSTVFPFINTAVRPRKGSAIVWYNLYKNGRGNYKTLHASCPVLLGQKWIATLWLSELGQEFVEPCSLDPHE